MSTSIVVPEDLDEVVSAETPKVLDTRFVLPDRKALQNKMLPQGIIVKQTRKAAANHEHYKKGPSLWPNPTIVVGLPKAGTKTIHEYFSCGHVERVSHYRCANNMKCGQLIHDNIKQHRPPLHGTGAFNVYTQLDVTAYTNSTSSLPCYYPQVELLEELHEHHPYSTLVLNKRNVTTWVASIKRWFIMHDRLIQCNITGFGLGMGRTDKELTQFYMDQVQRVRKFVAKHPTHRLVEVQIDSADAGQVMEDAFGIDKNCWGHTNKAQDMPILKKVA